ncbi:MAG: DUF1906 domain-containing protein [Polyangiaceae bacterium]|nr:DUF1906 domain-containing protein [Polyangiaceae bacterium]
MSKVYFFHETRRNLGSPTGVVTVTEYCRYDVKRDAADPDFLPPRGQYRLVRDYWPGLPRSGIDAALDWGDGRVYFFRGNWYYRFDTKLDRVDRAAPIAGNWHGLRYPDRELDRVDACVNWGNGKAYLFRGNIYWRYDMHLDRADPGYPLTIAGNWHGLRYPDREVDAIDGCINWGDGKAYLFRGGDYWRYDIALDRVDAHYPKRISDHWSGLFTSGVRAPVMLGFAGIDRAGYPGDAAMTNLWQNTNITWTGFYLTPAPSQGRNLGWMNRLAFLRGLGWGIAPIYVGQQEAGTPGSHVLTAAQGVQDVTGPRGAVTLAAGAGIPAGSILYLDIETGPPVSRQLAAYYQSWVQAVHDAGFRSGVYCSYLTARRLRALDDRPAFWVFQINRFRNGPGATYRNRFPGPEPLFSSVPFASAWQLAQNAILQPPAPAAAIRPMDFDSCSMRDPSQIP